MPTTIVTDSQNRLLSFAASDPDFTPSHGPNVFTVSHEPDVVESRIRGASSFMTGITFVTANSSASAGIDVSVAEGEYSEPRYAAIGSGLMVHFSDLPPSERRALLIGRQQLRRSRGKYDSDRANSPSTDPVADELNIHRQQMARFDHMLLDLPGVSAEEIDARLRDTPGYRLNNLWRGMAEETNPQQFYNTNASLEGLGDVPAEVRFVGSTGTTAAANNNALTINSPAGQVGDLMICITALNGLASISTLPEGWAAIDGSVFAPSDNLRSRVLAKVRTANEPASYTFTFAASGLPRSGLIMCYRTPRGFASRGGLAVQPIMRASRTQGLPEGFANLSVDRDHRLLYLYAVYATNGGPEAAQRPHTYEMIYRNHRSLPIGSGLPRPQLDVSAFDIPIFDSRYQSGVANSFTGPNIYVPVDHSGSILFAVRLAPA